jgi:predicted aspartyl protease
MLCEEMIKLWIVLGMFAMGTSVSAQNAVPAPQKSASPPTTAAAPTLSPALQAAQALYADGKFAQAEAAANKLPDGDKYSVAGLQLRARLELSANTLQAAQADLVQARHLARHNKTTLRLLALAYQRADRFVDAAPFFEQTDNIAEARVAQALAAKQPYRVEGLGVEARIKFLRTDPLPVVAVRLNGGDVRYFLVDTGAGEIYLDTEVARKLEIDDLGQTQGVFAKGDVESIGHGVLPSLAIGVWVVHDMPVILKDTSAYSKAGGGMKIDGVLGTEFLAHFVSTIDYRNGELQLRRKPPAPGAETAAQLQARMVAAGAKAIPLRWIGDHFLLAEGTVNGSAPMQFFVDTGLAGGGFTAPESTLKAAGIAVPAKGELAVFSAKQLTLGSGANQVTEKNITGIAGAFPPQLETMLGVRVGGLISHAFFRKYAITFDFAHMTLWLQ